MKRQSNKAVSRDKTRIIQAGYKLVQYQPWHWRIFKNDMACDVWPTKSKYMLRDSNWNVQFYTDIVKSLDAAFSMEFSSTHYPEWDAEQKRITRFGEFRDTLQAHLQAIGLGVDNSPSQK